MTKIFKNLHKIFDIPKYSMIKSWVKEHSFCKREEAEDNTVMV